MNDIIFLLCSITFSLICIPILIKSKYKVAEIAKNAFQESAQSNKNNNKNNNSNNNNDNNSSNELSQEPGNQQVLYDIIHFKWSQKFCELVSETMQNKLCYMLDISIFFYIYSFIFLAIFFTTPCNESGIGVLRLIGHGFISVTVTQIMRCVSYNLTILPQCDFRPKHYDLGTLTPITSMTPVDNSDVKKYGKGKNENSKSKNDHNGIAGKNSMARKIFDYASLRNVELGYKNDLLPSGHVLLVIVVNLLIHEYMTFPSWLAWIKIAIWLWAIVISFLILLMKKHYTIDVVYAYVVGFLFFEKYSRWFI